MRPKPRLRHCLLITFLVLALAPLGSVAETLDALRAAGTAGERFDGYLAARQADVPQDVRDKIAAINAKRREIYEKRAAEEGVPVDQVGRVYAKEIWEKAPTGTWFLRESGEWVQKPKPE